MPVHPELQMMVVVALLSQPRSFLVGKSGFLGSFSFHPLLPAGHVHVKGMHLAKYMYEYYMYIAITYNVHVHVRTYL